MIALSLADSRTVKQTKLSSRGLLTVRISVKSRTQCGSVRGSENLSTENHVELDEIKKIEFQKESKYYRKNTYKVRPVCGGNKRS